VEAGGRYRGEEEKGFWWISRAGISMYGGHKKGKNVGGEIGSR